MRTRSTRSVDREDAAQTRLRLVEAGLREFGLAGYEAANLRTITRAADANVSMISYHFGGKMGLYQAVVAQAARQAVAGFQPAIEIAETVLDEASMVDASQAIAGLLRPFLIMAIEAEPPPWGWIIIREQLSPSASFTVIHDQVVGRWLTLVAKLIAVHDGYAGGPTDMLRAIAMYGEVMVFISAKASVDCLLNDRADLRAPDRITEAVIKRHLGSGARPPLPRR